MSFIETIPPERAQGFLSELYDTISGARGGVGEVLAVQSLNPEALEAHFDLYATLMFGRSELDRRTREMIGVLVSARNGCPYCVNHHAEPLRRFEVDEELLEALGRGEIPEGLSPPVHELLVFARDLTDNPVADEARVDDLRDIGWSDRAILDATMLCGYFNFVNRVALGLGVALEENFERTTGEPT